MNVAKMYDDVSDRYQKLVDDSHYVGPRWISEKLKTFPIEQGSVLDLACATGSIGHVVKSHYPELAIHGLDISSKMVDKARQTNLYQSVAVHNLDEPFSPLFEQIFDLITALGFTEFLAEPQQLLECISHKLTANGRCFISFQYHDSDGQDLHRNTYSGSVVHKAYTESEVEQLCQQAGLEVVSLENVIGYVSGVGYVCRYLMLELKKSHR
ncbi:MULTISPECIES: class I SAM-dependent DNA methyltransferase [Vibrio]|uniref:class I SAM-dependent DNA methyltransferase n=1 Tax=Vibrio TaxID=662 RepID=UPI0014834141|nr:MULTISPECIES: class I SAM-dependent methyltransferase [Vibrio]ELA9082538.1 methyltransferase domain-containing protein [Vibrio alginolyticus]ELI1833614.1 methyltransferase domain-containing protein [Vibrio alginolyticus]MBO0137521.1 methyltransferase domain-containing protein [Vibrio sp. Vb2736]MBS9819061.1 methyltransferase domain-containing protein [Vibrio alginolyticus]MBS9822682.1 methyltransferase domain-containing protein [Vibrio alginolyticus]